MFFGVKFKQIMNKKLYYDYLYKAASGNCLLTQERLETLLKLLLLGYSQE